MKRNASLIAASAVLLITASFAIASIGDPIFVVEAKRGAGGPGNEGTYSVPLSALSAGGTWSQAGSFDILGGGGPLDRILTIESAVATYNDDPLTFPQASLAYQLKAGDQDVEVRVYSAVITSNLPDAEAIASTAFTLTDEVNAGDFAEIAALGNNGSGMFNAYYTDAGGEQLFTSLINSLSINGGGTGNSGTTYWPPSGTFAPLNTDVQSFRVEYGFTLTATDSMSSTNNYFLTPEPASLALVSVALLLRRRR